MPRSCVQRLCRAVLVASLISGGALLRATPPSWAGGNGNASQSNKWSTNTTPTSSDVVTISTGSVTVDLPNLTFGALTFSGGNLNGANTLNLGNAANSSWTAGTMTFSSGGGVAVSSGAVLGISTTSDHDFSASNVSNSGTVNWSGGRLRSGNGGNISNSGTWNDTASTTLNNDLGGTAWSFTNNSGGTYNKSATGTTTFEVGFTNNGTVSVSSGRLNLHGGGSSNGTLNVSGTGNDIYIDSSYSLGNGSSISGTVRAAAGTLTMSGNITANGLSIEGASIAGTHTLSGGAVNWTSGNLNASATTTLTSTATFNISGGSDHDFSNRAIVNGGTVNWSGGRLRSGNGGTITNNSVFNDSASTDVNNDYGGTAMTFTNSSTGTYNKTAAGQTKFLVPFNNSGHVNINAGTLNLNGGGTLSSGGSLTAASGASVIFSNNYTLADASALSGAGSFSLSDGTLTATGNVNVSNFGVSGGHLAGTQTFNGGLSWNAGDLNSSGTTTVGNASSFTISGSNDHDFSNRSLVNNGTTNWSGGRLRSGNSGAFTNNGTFNDTASTDINNDYGGTAMTFTNASGGTYNKSAVGTTRFLVGFNNSGHVNVTAGTLELNGGGTLSAGASLSAASGTNVVFSNSYTLADASALSGNGTFSATAGTLTATGNISVSNFSLSGGHLAGTHTFNGGVGWSTGDLNSAGTTTIANTSTFTITGTNDHDFSARALVNNGTTNWSGGRLRSGNSGTLTNNGTFNDSASNDVNNDYGGSVAVFTNAVNGTYNKTSAGQTRYFVPFNNSGHINVNAGTLNFAGGGTLSSGGALNAASGANVIFSNDYTLADASSLTGTGSFSLSGGTLTAVGNVNVSNFSIAGGHLSGSQTFNGGLGWTAGDLNGNGSTTIANGTNFTISGGNDHDFSNRSVINNGTTNWNGGRLRSGNGGSFTNNGVFNDSAASDVNNDYGGSALTFTNGSGGTYNKSGNNTSRYFVPFINNGAISVSSGTLQLNGGGNFGSGASFHGAGVTQLVSGVFTATGNFDSTSLVLDGGQIAGTHSFTGVLKWNNGNFNNAGATTIANGANLQVTSGSDHDFSAHGFINNGTFDWANGAGRLRGGNGATFLNQGVFNDNASSDINNDYGGTALVFTNASNGTYHKLGSGNTNIFIPFDNSGTVTIDVGSLFLRGGGTFSGGSFTGSGNTQLISGSFAINGSFHSDNLILSGATLTGSPELHGILTYLNGFLGGGVTSKVMSDGTLVFSSGADHDMPGHALVNNGTINWDGGRIRGGNSSTITNNGVFNDTASQSINSDYGGTALLFTNSSTGVYHKTGSGNTDFFIPFNNSGTVNIGAGSLLLHGGGTFSTGASFTGGGSTQLVAGTFTLNGSIQSNNLILSGATLAGSPQLHGLVTYLNGLLASGATSTVASDGVMVIGSGADHDMPGHSLINNGVVNWTGGRIRGGNGATFTNNSVFNDQASTSVNNDYGGPTFTFNNALTGTYTKSGSGTTVFGVPFTNSGTLAITAGTMVFNSSFTNQGSILLANSASAQFSGPLSFATGKLGGTGTINASSVSAGGIVAPGSSPGQLNIVGNFSLLSTSMLLIELGGTNQGSGYDFLNINGTANLSGNLSLSFVNNFQLSILSTNTFTVLTANGGLSGAFSNIASGQRLTTSDGLGSFKVSYSGIDSVVLSEFIPVPEPSTYALMGLGLAIVGAAYRRRKNRS